MLKPAYAMWYLWALIVYYFVTPFFLKCLGLRKLFFVSLVMALLVGFVSRIGLVLNLSRSICFYPFFLLGLVMKSEFSKQILTQEKTRVFLSIMVACVLVYIVANLLKPGIVFATGLSAGFGLSLSGMVIRLFTYAINIVMCVAMTQIVPNRSLWFTKYGERTMNVYLLHMLVVFPVCWHFTTPFLYTWYGMVINIILVPIVCLLFFSAPVDKMMRKLRIVC